MIRDQKDFISRKKAHLSICETDEAAFISKKTGFDKYDFLHHACTEVDLSKINFETDFFGLKVGYPFFISCMTGGVDDSDKINLQLAEAAAKLNIPLGLGSLRYALNKKEFDSSLIEIRSALGDAPLMGNLGAHQLISEGDNFEELKRLVKICSMDAFVIHLNPLQELLQKNGEPYFTGLKQALKKFTAQIEIPVIVKEVGSGISKKAALEMLECGVSGIDTAGAGGTSWAAVEILRNNNSKGNEFWDWGLPTSYCISTINELRNKHSFMLMGSGGINDAFSMAKAFALGADLCGSARIILQTLRKNGVDGVVELVKDWFVTMKNIMYLTGAQTLPEFDDSVLIMKEKLY